jgi:hypothetical protein
MEPEPLLDSLRSAVNAMPDDVPLRLHLATMLLSAGQRDEAVRHLGAVLQRDPGNAEAMRLLTAPVSGPAEVSGPPASPPADVDNSSERVRGFVLGRNGLWLGLGGVDVRHSWVTAASLISVFSCS